MVTPARFRRGVVLGLVTVCLVGLVVGMLTALQRQLIYFPDSTTVPAAGGVLEAARDITLHTSDGLALGAWFVPPTSASDMRMAVLAAPGNGSNRLGLLGLASELSRRGLAVVLVDYRGYGGNPSSPSEDTRQGRHGCLITFAAHEGAHYRTTFVVTRSGGHIALRASMADEGYLEFA